MVMDGNDLWLVGAEENNGHFVTLVVNAADQ